MPMKVVRHLSLIARLKRIYSSPTIANLLKWHSERAVGMNDDKKMRMETVINSPA